MLNVLLSGCFGKVSSAVAKIIKDNAMLRALIKECEEIANDCYMAKEDVDTILEKTEKNVFRLCTDGSEGLFGKPDAIIFMRIRSRHILPDILL